MVWRQHVTDVIEQHASADAAIDEQTSPTAAAACVDTQTDYKYVFLLLDEGICERSRGHVVASLFKLKTYDM